MTATQAIASPSIEQWVCAERVRVLYAGIKIAAICGPIGLIILSGLFWSVVDHQRIIAWAVVCGVAISPASLILLACFRLRNQLPGDAQYWLTLVRWRYFLLCAASGAAGVVLFAEASITHQMIIFCFLVALASTQTIESAQDRWIYMTSLPALLAPFIVRAAAHSDDTSHLLALLAGAALAYVLPTARNLSKMIDESLNTRFENLALIAQLKAQTELLETTRDDAVRARDEAEGFAYQAGAARTQAVQANQAKSRFLAAASHDLRQPVHALGLFAAAARAHVQGDEGRAIMDKIAASIDSTEALFNALLDVSRLDAGILVPDVQPFALDDLLHRLVDEYAPRTAAKGVSLRWRTGAKTITSDPALLERVLRNYLSNAIRYTRHGAILVACRTRGASLRIEVWDTGAGIAADKLDDIFQEFYQIGNPERNKANGLGLGLAIVKRIANLLGHSIEVKSSLHRGSRFSITVPLAQAVSLRVGVSGASDAQPAPDESLLIGAVVLVIDDEVVVLQAVEMLLRQWGCLVVAAPTLDEALHALHALDRTPDVILCDYRLQGVQTGIAVIQQLRQTLGPIPGALITGDTAPDRLREASQSGLPLLHKPLNAQQLKTSLCALLTRKRPADTADSLCGTASRHNPPLL
jgi:two-component system, sensor histidine kinase